MIEQPSEYKFEDIKIGDKKRFVVTIDDSLMGNFALISGDYNPLHMDENYVKTTTFKKRVCHGMLLASFFSRLVGMYLPGKNALYFSQTLNFQSPCFVGDQVTVEGEVIEKSQSTKIITIKTTILDKLGKLAVDGVAKVIVREVDIKQ
jgi:acyl dehydratase